MDNCPMTYMNVVSNRKPIRTSMNDAIVLNMRTSPDSYSTEVPAYHCAGPNTRMFANLHITDDIGSFANKS